MTIRDSLANLPQRASSLESSVFSFKLFEPGGSIAFGYVRMRKIDGRKEMPRVTKMLNEVV